MTLDRDDIMIDATNKETVIARFPTAVCRPLTSYDGIMIFGDGFVIVVPIPQKDDDVSVERMLGYGASPDIAWKNAARNV